MLHSEHSTPEATTPVLSTDMVYMVTGANRGLGLGFCKALLLRPLTTVVATVRDPSNAHDLRALQCAEGSRLIVAEIDGFCPKDPTRVVEELQTTHGLTHLDTVIANAGIESWFGPAASIPLDQLREHFEVNALAPLALFQATWPLLQRSTNPKFVPISSRLGSVTEIARVQNPAAAYGASKAMLNYLTCRMHHENAGLVAFPMSPGFVQTDMGNAGARKAGMKQAVFTVEQSVGGMLRTIDDATREKHGGTFQSWDGTTFDW
ncbi:hypothetical protein LTR53_004116 [Teratosphaeriaceae sp. CCFEE 6253]|nr:hypothetical protein LTR53_004116 [Teratosphaeriaceae sp. CCFEE 6253]